MKENCFTEFYCILSNLNMNQIYVCIYPLPFETPTHLPPYPTPSVAQRVKRLLTMQETWVRSLDQEDPVEKETATHSSTLAWKISWTEKPGRLQSMGSQRVGHDWASSLHFETPTHPPPYPTPSRLIERHWVSWAIQQIPIGYLFYIW